MYVFDGGRLGPAHRIHQCGEAVGLADDHLGVFAERGRRELALEQLRGAAQSAERVFDLVGELANHQAAAVEARQQVVVARDALALRGVGELEQQVRAGEPQERGHRDIERARLARRVGGLERHFAVGETFAGLERAPEEGVQRAGIVQVIAEGAPTAHVEAEREQVLGRDVGVDRAQLRVQHQDPGRERIQELGRVEVRKHRGAAVLSSHGATPPRGP